MKTPTPPRSFVAIFSTLSLVVDVALAQSQGPIIQVPYNISQCVPARFNWTGGVPPFTFIATPVIQNPVDHIEGFANISEQSFIWTPDFTPETVMVFSVHDRTGAFAVSGGVTLSGSNDQSCMSAPSSTSSTPEASSTADEGDSVDSPSTDASSHGLSGGAIAGIVVGSLVGAALLAFLAMWLRRKRVQAFRKRHRATRSDWQALADIPYKGEYPFSSGDAQVKNHGLDMPAPPSPAMKRPGEVDGGMASRRAAISHSLDDPPTSPF